MNGETETPPPSAKAFGGKSEKFRTIHGLLTEMLVSEQLNRLLADFQRMVGVSAAIIDLDGTVLAASQWQRLCTDLHRLHPNTRERCIESDTELANRLESGAEFTIYRCKNGLTDCASPIVIEGEHVANLFVGQFLLQPPDTEFFKRQAEQFGFQGGEYMEALAEVPVVAESRVPAIVDFLVHFAQLLASMGLDRLRERQLALPARLGRIIENSLNEIYVFDADTLRFLLVNHGARNNLGYKMEELRGLTPLDLKPLFTPESFEEQIQPLRTGELDVLAFNSIHRRKDGSLYDVEVHLQLMRDETPPVFAAIIQDVTKRNRMEEELRELATTDPLTGVANRRHFFQQVEEEMHRVQRYGDPAALLMIDLDHFKRINDTHGHGIGDYVLCQFTSLAQRTLRDTDLLGRIGGEEFAVLLPETDLAAATAFAERIRRLSAAVPIDHSGIPIACTISIGVTAIAPTDPGPDAILARADRALYRAKERGRNRVEPLPVPQPAAERA